VLWELLTRDRLFMRQTDAQTLRAVLEHDVPHVCDLAPEVPRALGDVAAKALQRRPAARHATTRELARELRAALVPRTASLGEVSESLELLFPGEREASQIEIARMESSEPHIDFREEPTALWLDVEEEPSLSATPVTVSRAHIEPATTPAPATTSPPSPAHNPWRTATWALLAAALGLFAGVQSSSEPPASPPPTMAPAAVVAPASEAAERDEPQDLRLELWAPDPATRKLLCHDASPSGEAEGQPETPALEIPDPDPDTTPAVRPGTRSAKTRGTSATERARRRVRWPRDI
jgi:serine/threonine-protein kinase